MRDNHTVMDKESIYWRIFLLTTDRLAYVDRQYIYRAANDGYCEALGTSRDEIEGHAVTDYFDTNIFHEILKGHIDECFKGKPVRYQFWIDLNQTGNRYLDVSYYPDFDDNGNVVGAVVSTRDITELKQAEDIKIEHAASLAKEEGLKISRKRIAEAQELIRKDIAEQLHGKVQSRLIVLTHQLTTLAPKVRPDVADELNDIRTNLSELAEKQIHPISHRLYPSITRQGIVPALQSLVDQFGKALTFTMIFDAGVEKRERTNRRLIPEWTKLAAYRITEEALNNVVKHADASQVAMKLEMLEDNKLRLSIKDNGKGFNIKKRQVGLGTSIMKDYAEIIGGECQIKSTPGAGTEVILILPLVKLGDGHGQKDLPSE